jgi:hypothetical protein
MKKEEKVCFQHIFEVNLHRKILILNKKTFWGIAVAAILFFLD